MIKSPNRTLTMMEPALVRIACIMARKARFCGLRGRWRRMPRFLAAGRRPSVDLCDSRCDRESENRHDPVRPQHRPVRAPAARRAEMADRKHLVAGNWKMNGLRADGIALARALAERASGPH